jgi:hypothetical protein
VEKQPVQGLMAKITDLNGNGSIDTVNLCSKVDESNKVRIDTMFDEMTYHSGSFSSMIGK